MALKSKLAGGLAVAALVLASASPANARGYPNRWHHGHDRGVDAGTVVGAILGVGIIAAIASAASNKNQAPNRTYDDPRYDPRYDSQADNRGYEDRNYDGRAADGRSYDNSRADHADVDMAVDACAVAARDEASRSGGFAEVRGITDTQPYGGGWNVTGTLDQRSSYSAGDSSQRSFRCIWENGQVSGVTFGQAV
jgi:hypothetical protein